MKDLPHNSLEGEKPELVISLHDGSSEQISIIVVHKDAPEYLNLCIQSIAVTTQNSNVEIIVVDNASTSVDSKEYLDEIQEKGIKVVRNNKNLYWSQAANNGVEAANKKSKYLIFMHCDVVVLNPGWLDILISVSEGHNSGVVGTEMHAYMVEGQTVQFVREWLMLMTRECWEDIGPFPEKLPVIGHSFILSIKAKSSGYNPQVIKNQIAHHYHISSYNINEYERLIEEAHVTMPQLLKDTQTQSI
jgi:GT2 family glycosyltransferase